MDYSQKTYNDLMSLVKNNEAFYFQDRQLEDKTYRIFNYQLASWSSFLEPSALECRGIMFDVTNEDEPILVALPPEKFFNYEEGNVAHYNGKIGVIMEKLDGSLISTYLHNNKLLLKSKGALASDHAVLAMKMLTNNKPLYNALKEVTHKGYTLSLELTSPEYRIVVSYQTNKLSVLCLRSHINGNTFYGESLIKELERVNISEESISLIKANQVQTKIFPEAFGKDEFEKFVENIRAEEIGEGYVVEIISDDDNNIYNRKKYLTKIKNHKYLSLHHTKDSINSNKRLFEVIINQASDDLKSLFSDDQYVLDKIAEMESKVMPIYNNIIHEVESFYESNKELNKKEYALKAINDSNPHAKALSGLRIGRYINRENDYKAFAMKHMKDVYGINLTEENLETNEDNGESTLVKVKV